MTDPDTAQQPSPEGPSVITQQVHTELFGSIYQTLGGRRLGYDTMMWQVPAISFTAQAFLLTIALGGGRGLAQVVSAGLALSIALISMQLMAKHRLNEEIDSRLLEAFEKRVNIEAIIGCPPHAPPGVRMRTVNSSLGAYSNVTPIRPTRFTRLSSYKLWQRGLGLFALTSAGIITVNAIYLAGLDALIIQWLRSLGMP